MERTLANVSTDGRFILRTEVKMALGIPAEAQVEIVVGGQDIRLLIDHQRNGSIPHLDAMRLEHEDIDALAGSLAGGPDMVAELQLERRQDKW